DDVEARLVAGVEFHSLPVEGADLPGVDEPAAQEEDEDGHLHESVEAELPEDEGPGIEERRVHVEEDEEHAHEVELDREPLARGADGRYAALVDRALPGIRTGA